MTLDRRCNRRALLKFHLGKIIPLGLKNYFNLIKSYRNLFKSFQNLLNKDYLIQIVKNKDEPTIIN